MLAFSYVEQVRVSKRDESVGTFRFTSVAIAAVKATTGIKARVAEVAVLAAATVEAATTIEAAIAAGGGGVGREVGLVGLAGIVCHVSHETRSLVTAPLVTRGVQQGHCRYGRGSLPSGPGPKYFAWGKTLLACLGDALAVYQHISMFP